MKKRFRKTAKVALVMIYLVIIAGAVVRMTGSGMGCPDWPKCFGYYIPPTEVSELQFKPNHSYEKGVVIILNESLKVAKTDFKSSNTIDLKNWEDYTQHDYAVFNPLHTWVEYINRLIGAASGIPILIFTIMSIWLWKDRERFLILSILTVFAMAFQAWLGKTVVDSNLAPYKITVHMVMALVIVAIILYLIFIAKETTKHQRYDKWFRHIMVFATLLTLVQIILGTQVRQYVDEQVKDIGYIKSQWLADPTVSFYVHRTLSLLVLAVNGWLFYRNKTLNLGYTKLNIVLIGIGLEIVTGILMYYFDFPFTTQPIHLVIAAILIGIQFYLVLESNQKKINVNRIEFEKS